MNIPDLDEHILDPDPIRQFLRWYADAAAAHVPQHDAMTLATATSGGQVSARVVLLKHVDGSGFVFYTNYNSRKGREIAANSSAALVFLWKELNRSVRIEGTVAKIPAAESDAYFASRPRDSQLSSVTSNQSEVVPDRAYLDRLFDDMRKKYEGKPVPRPAHWGGYRVAPKAIEFWQHRFARLNDRVLYQVQAGGGWTTKRLSP